MNTESIFNNKKIILDNFNKGKFEKVIKLGKKFLKKNIRISSQETKIGKR